MELYLTLPIEGIVDINVAKRTEKNKEEKRK